MESYEFCQKASQIVSRVQRSHLHSLQMDPKSKKGVFRIITRQEKELGELEFNKL